MQETQVEPPKPKWFTPITVSAIVLGSLFACCGVTTVGGQLVSRATSPAMVQASVRHAQNEEAAAATRAYMERSFAIQARVFPYALTAGVISGLHGLALLAAGFMAYKRRTAGRTLLIWVCLIGLGVDLMTTSLSLYVANETSAHTMELMKSSLAANQPKGAADSERVRETSERVAAVTARVTRILGLMAVVGMFVFKAAFYIVCAIYLKRPAVVAFFEGTGDPPSSMAQGSAPA